MLADNALSLARRHSPAVPKSPLDAASLIPRDRHGKEHQPLTGPPMADSKTSKDSSTSGITTTSSGQRHVPSSTRADGSKRKEIRVRPGYRPPEDVQVYKNRTAEAFRSRGTAGIPGATFASSDQPRKQQPKNDARKDKSNVSSPGHTSTKPAVDGLAVTEKTEVSAPPDPEAEKEKEARKLGKKLRQARDLEQKKVQGDSLLPEQLDKIIKINELTRQLEKLGFGADGERKTEPF